MTNADQGGWTPPLTQEEVRAAIMTLPPEQREFWFAARSDGLSYAEVAERYGISARRVERRLANILGHLRREIERNRLVK